MTDPTYVGIDVSKHTLAVARLTGDTYQQQQLANQPAAVAQFVLTLLEAPPAWIVLEATGPYHRLLAAALADADLRVHLANPARIAAFRSAQVVRNKTDPQDARVLARFGQREGGQLRRYTPPTAAQQVLRSLLSYRELLVKQRTQLLGAAETVSRGGAATVQAMLTEDLAQLATRIDQLEAQLAAQTAALPEAAVLRQQCGCGPLLAATTLALLPVGLWGDPKGAAAYAGVHPRQCQSGQRRVSRLSKQGSAQLRRYLYLGALAAKRADPDLAAIYERHVSRGMAPAAARVVLMHTLLRRLMGKLKAYYAQRAPDAA